MSQREIDREEWRSVVGYEGLYEVSSHGRVRSLDRVIVDKRGHARFHEGKNIRTHRSKTGYMRVAISRDCKSYNTGIHRLVAQAFVKNPNNYDQVNHLNEDKEDNHYTNLEWSSASHNVNWGTRNDRVAAKMEKPVIATRISDGKEFYFKSIAEAKRMGHTPTRVSKSKLKRYDGYYWRYADDAEYIVPEFVDLKKPIVAINLETNKQMEFESLHEAKRQGHSRERVKRVLNGLQSSYHGCIWKYKDN